MYCKAFSLVKCYNIDPLTEAAFPDFLKQTLLKIQKQGIAKPLLNYVAILQYPFLYTAAKQFFYYSAVPSAAASAASLTASMSAS